MYVHLSIVLDIDETDHEAKRIALEIGRKFFDSEDRITYLGLAES